MITAREKLQVGLGVIGLSLFGLGMAFYNFGAEEKEIRNQEHRVGFWKDSGMTEDSEKELAPWMFGCGIAAITVAYIIREK